jgi:hypothetical protein
MKPNWTSANFWERKDEDEKLDWMDIFEMVFPLFAYIFFAFIVCGFAVGIVLAIIK